MGWAISKAWQSLTQRFCADHTEPSTEVDKPEPAAVTNASSRNEPAVSRGSAEVADDVWTIENTRLPNFHPAGLAVDDRQEEEEEGTEVDNPYLPDPVRQQPDVQELDRPLQQHRPGQRYFLPNDFTELSRLDRQHVMWRHILDGDLAKAPIKEDVRHALDLGAGSGVWTAEFAKEHPDCAVLGIDLSKPEPKESPPNCRFEERDFTEPWDYHDRKFDYIHGRLIFVAQSSPKALLRRAFDALAPGGYLEFQELYGVPQCPDGTYEGTFSETFFLDTVMGSRNLGNDMLCMPHFQRWMQEMGFEDVVEDQRALPNGPWPRGAYKPIGSMQAHNLRAGMGAIYSNMLVKGLGWSAERTAAAIARAADEMTRNANIHAYFPVYVVHGRKPPASRP